jgi:hypothetical protein
MSFSAPVTLFGTPLVRPPVFLPLAIYTRLLSTEGFSCGETLAGCQILRWVYPLHLAVERFFDALGGVEAVAAVVTLPAPPVRFVAP